MSQADQAWVISEAVDLAPAYDWAGPIIWYAYKDRGGSATNVENWFGIIGLNCQRKETYAFFRDLAREQTRFETEAAGGAPTPDPAGEGEGGDGEDTAEQEPELGGDGGGDGGGVAAIPGGTTGDGSGAGSGGASAGGTTEGDTTGDGTGGDGTPDGGSGSLDGPSDGRPGGGPGGGGSKPTPGSKIKEVTFVTIAPWELAP